jgi:uncharacterized membrane protein
MNWLWTLALCMISGAIGFMWCALLTIGRESDREYHTKCEGTSDD